MPKNTKPGIYLLAFPDGNYVGQSNNVVTRINKHRSQMLEGIHPNKRIRNGYAKYGLPEIKILAECSLAELNAAEVYFMKLYNCYPNGYNQKPGGDYKRNGIIDRCYSPIVAKKKNNDVGNVFILISCLLLLSTIFIAAIVKSAGLAPAILIIFALYAIIKIWP